jgi:hypothetical protein
MSFCRTTVVLSPEMRDELNAKHPDLNWSAVCRSALQEVLDGKRLAPTSGELALAAVRELERRVEALECYHAALKNQLRQW